MASADVTALEVVVHGHVQGVWFRASTRDIANEHGVTGWVRNEREGTVRAHFEGPPDAVDAVVSWVREGGPSRARVNTVDVIPTDPQDYDLFMVT